MRCLVFTAIGCLLTAPALFSQAATQAQVRSGINTMRTRQLHSLSDPAEPAGKQAGNVPWKSLSSEQGDDPTLSAATPPHEASKPARKAAAKAEHLSKKGDHEAAILGFREALTLDPQYYEAENNLALELELVGKNQEAENTLRQLAQKSPEHILASANLASLLCREHRYSEAETVAREALAKHRYSFKASFLLGTALVDEGHWTDEAKLALQYAQVKYPEVASVLDRWPSRPAPK